VAAGQVVARLDPAPLDPRGREQAEAALRAARASAAEARARVAEARTARESSRSTLARVERLAASGQVSEEDLELGRSEERRLSEALAAAEARARAADFAVEAAAAALLGAAAEGAGAAVPVRSPVGGVVLRLLEESERVVGAGTPLLEVGDPEALEVVVDVLTGDALAVRPGAEMLLDAGSGAESTLRARVRRVEPAAFTKVSPLGVEEQRVYVVADLLAPAPRLGDRFRVEAQIVLWRGEAVLQTPAAALFRRGEEWAAFVVAGGRARERAVTVGHRGASEVEVVAGLAEGDVVILYPSDRVAEGARLALP
jgi:HlyD family secretion protein